MESIFRAVLNMSITGAYIAAAIMIVRLFLKRLPKRFSYALWLILGIRLICPFSLSSAASLFNLISPETEESVMSYIPEAADRLPMPYEEVPAPQINEAVNTAINTAIPAPVPESSADTMLTIMSVCAVIWLAGMFALLIYTAVSYIRVKRLVRGSVRLRDNIYVCGRIEAPFVFGIMRPLIYIPEGVSRRDMGYIAAHENTHISRGDHIIKLLAMSILSLHWFNPMIWIAFRLMIKDMELSCDERAVMSFSEDVRKEYANALLNMSLRQNRLNGLLAFGESNIKSRIKGVLSLKKPSLPAVAAAVIIIGAAGVCLLTNAEKSGISLPESYGSCSVSENTYGGENEVLLSDESVIRSITEAISSAKLKRISEKRLSFNGGGMEHEYSFRMYKGPELTGEFDSVTVPTGRLAAPKDEYYITYSSRGRTEYYLISEPDRDRLLNALSKRFNIFETGTYSPENSSGYTLYIGTGGYSFELGKNGETVYKGLMSDFENDGLTRYYCENGERVLAFMWNGGGSLSVSRTDSAAEDYCGRYVHAAEYEKSRIELGSSFKVSQSGEGYEAHSPLTDIYLYFSESDPYSIIVRRDRNGTVEENELSYTLNPYYSNIKLWDITEDGTDDIFIFTEITGTGVTSNAVAVIDGESMMEIPLAGETEKLITLISKEYIQHDDFSESHPMLVSAVFEGAFDDQTVFPLYPDKSVKRYGGTHYELNINKGILSSESVFWLIKDENRYSKVYTVNMVHRYGNGIIASDKIIPQNTDNEENPSFSHELAEKLDFCESYLTDYWNDLLKTGSFSPEKYIDDYDMYLLACAKKAANGDIVGAPNVQRVRAKRDGSREVQSGVTSEGRTWICFVYDVEVYLSGGKADNSGFTGYKVYFELDGSGEDMRIYREYDLHAASLDELGFDTGEEIPLPLENVDINEVRKRVTPRSVYDVQWREESRIFDVMEDKRVRVSFLIPPEWRMSYSTAYADGIKTFEICGPYPVSEGIDTEIFKIDEAHGYDVTVNEEKYGGENDLFDYYIFTSVPNKSPDGYYDAYYYVVRDGDYYITLVFVSDAGTSDDTISKILSSVSIRETN